MNFSSASSLTFSSCKALYKEILAGRRVFSSREKRLTKTESLNCLFFLGCPFFVCLVSLDFFFISIRLTYFGQNKKTRKSRDFEPLASRHANLSHRGMRDIRIEACETFASRHARYSYRGMRDIRIEACEPFASRHARHSHRAVQDLRTEQCKTFAPRHARYSHTEKRLLVKSTSSLLLTPTYILSILSSFLWRFL